MDTTILNNAIISEQALEGSNGGPYMVEQIKGLCTVGNDNKIYFLVKWSDSWEPAENLSEGCQNLVDEYCRGSNQATHNLKVGQKTIKTEEVICPEVTTPVTVTSSTEQQKVSVSSTNDHKLTDVSSSNDLRQNLTSNKTSNDLRQNLTSNKNRNPQSTNQNKHSQQPANQNRGSHQENQSRNIHSKDNKTNLNRVPPPVAPNVDSKSKKTTCSTVSSTKSNNNNKIPSGNHNNDFDHGVSITHNAPLLVTIDKPLTASSPKTPKRLHLSSPTKEVLSSPGKRMKSSPIQTLEGSNPLALPNAKNDKRPPDTAVIPDDGEVESKLNVRSKSPLTKTNVTNPTPVDHKNTLPTSHPPSHTLSLHQSPPQSKSEFKNKPITSSTALHDISTIPIKMASPTSVVPVEATSTIEDDAELDDGVKVGAFSPTPNVKKKLKFNNGEFIPQSAEGPSPKASSSTSVDNPPLVTNMNPRHIYQDRNNVLHSSPYYSDIADSDYDQDNEASVGVGAGQNTFRSGGFGDGMESNQGGTQFIGAMDDNNDNYTTVNDEEEDAYIGYDEDVNSNNNNNFVNNNFQNVRSNINEENFINILEGDDDQDNYEYENEGDTESWMEGNQGNDSMLPDYDSQSEEVIALDSDDNGNDNDDLEFIGCIDSSQTRNRGRLPASLQQSRHPDVATPLPAPTPPTPTPPPTQTKRGRPVNQRGRRGRPSQRGKHVVNTVPILANDQTTNGNLGGNMVPLVHPRLLLSSPQTQEDDPSTTAATTTTIPTPTLKRGNRRGGGASRNNKKVSNKMVPTPPKTNQQNAQVISANAAPSFTTPPRKRQRPNVQETMLNTSNNEGPLVQTQATPPQNKNKPHSDIQQRSPSLDCSPSRTILNDRTCTICNHAFANLTLARQHAKQVHANQYGSPSSAPPSPSLVCQVCKATFKTNKDLKSHMLLHGNLNLHKCEVCFRAFKQRSVLAQHLLIHSEQLPYACSICDKRFRQQGHLILHLGTHGRNNEGTYTCPRCSIDYTDENSFAEHMRQHDAELPFKCNFCQQRFEMKSNLMLHLEGHNEGRPFTCHICKKSFKTKTYYFGHMQMHKIRDNQQNRNKQSNEFGEMDGGDVIKND